VVETISNAGFPEDLVHEAVYRANGNANGAREYCHMHKTGVAGSRHPIPTEDADTSALAEPTPASGQEASSTSDADRMSLDASPDISIEGPGDLTFRTHQPDEAGEGTNTDPAASTGDVKKDQPSEPLFITIKQNLDEERAKLRKDLIDQCLDIIRAHPDTAIEVAELINAVVLRQQNQETQEEVGSTLTFALSSLGLDDEEKKRNGKCIAAYAHLLALLLQDEKFFDSNIESLRDKTAEYVAFLKLPPSASADDLPPWIPFILLVLEILLCYDEKPVAAQWKPPKSLEENVAQPVIEMRTPMVDDEQRVEVLNALLDLLPRVGKEEVLATAVLRVLVILTRRRHLAKLVGDKKNLQRLFLMAKQLSSSGSERLKQTKMTAHIITILRHVIEDEDIVKQIMRAEVRAEFPNLQRSQRGHPDVTTYLRALAPIALRAPDLFVEVSNEIVRFSRWIPPSNEGGRTPPLVLAEQATEKDHENAPSDDAAAAGQDIKQSTEPVDKEMTDAPKQLHDSKRPVVENPDGVIHFLLCELVNYREVDDKEPSSSSLEEKKEPSSGTETPDPMTKDNTAEDGKDKKPTKPAFKPEEHPIFIYRCFLLNCLAELLQSYNRTKVEFINFKRSAPPLTTNTPVKPRSSVLNYLIYDLLCQGNLSGTTDSLASKKAATSSQTQKVLVALVARTNEKPIDRTRDKFAYDDEPDLLFVRKFVLDTVLKAYERAPTFDEPLETRYSRLQCLAELMNHMIGEKDKEQNSGSRNTDNSQSRSQAQLRRLMYEKGYLDKLTSSIAEINLNYPGVKRAIKYILRVLRVLTDTAKELSHSNILPSDSAGDNTEDDFASASSLSDLEDEREETPDLYRNSTLGMLEPRGDDDESEDEDEDDDEDMYGEDYDEEMDYGEDDISDGEDDISDDDEELSEMGEIEGLSGEPGVVEVIMDDDDDEDDDDDDSDEDDDDDMESAEMDHMDHHVEIIDEDGNPLSDDGNSEWESESEGDDEEDPEADELDYEAEIQDEDELHGHPMGPGDLLARAIMGDENEFEPELMDGLDHHFMGDGHDEPDDDDDDEDDIEDEEYIYDDDYPLDDQLPPMPALGWDGLNPEVEDRRQLFLLEGNNRRPVLTRMDNRGSFPPRFMAGSNRDHLGGK
jgi:E3 ubiquitin-protein ligase HUWE1